MSELDLDRLEKYAQKEADGDYCRVSHEWMSAIIRELKAGREIEVVISEEGKPVTLKELQQSNSTLRAELEAAKRELEVMKLGTSHNLPNDMFMQSLIDLALWLDVLEHKPTASEIVRTAYSKLLILQKQLATCGVEERT